MKINEIQNLTPHTLNIQCADGTFMTVEPSGVIARVETTGKPEEPIELDGSTVQVERTSLGEVINLPPVTFGVRYVVSAVAKAACPERDDILRPGPLVRNDEGQPIGCQGLSL